MKSWIAILSFSALMISCLGDDLSLCAVAGESDEISESPEWKKLIHWQHPLKSRGFYLSGLNGPVSPEAELNATLKAFDAEINLDLSGILHPQCLFKDRLLFLKQKLPSSRTQNWTAPCEPFQNWLDLVDPSRISVEFFDGDSDLNFHFYGDIAIKFHRKLSTNDVKPRQDYGLLIALDPAPSSPLHAMLGSLDQSIAARFITLPWEQALEGITNRNQRNLWEYDLNLSEGEIQELLAHLWTLGQFQFSFGAFSQNSTRLMTALFELSRFSSHSIFGKKALTSIESLQNGRLTLSLEQRLNLFRERLDPEVKKLVDQLIASDRPIDELLQSDTTSTEAEKSLALDVALETLKSTRARSRRSNELLIARTDFQMPSLSWEDMNHSFEDSDPKYAHGPHLISAGMGNSQYWGAFYDLSFRLLGHDRVQSPAGYSSETEFKVLDLQIRNYANSAKNPSSIRLGQSTLFSVQNNQKGYLFSAGVRPYWEKSANEAIGEVHAGIGLKLFRRFSTFAEIETALATSHSPSARIGPAVSAQWSTVSEKRFSWINEGHAFFKATGFGQSYLRLTSEARIALGKNWSLRGQFLGTNARHASLQTEEALRIAHEF